MATCKCKDIVAVERGHSAFYLKGPSSHYITYTLAKVEHATRDGIAKAVRLSNGGFLRIEAGGSTRVLTLPAQYQDAAAALHSERVADFHTADELKDALRAKVAA